MADSTPPREVDAMVCRACGQQERASEGYPCRVCGTFICLICSFRGTTECVACSGKAPVSSPQPGG